MFHCASCFWYFHVMQIHPGSFYFTDRLPASRKTLARVLEPSAQSLFDCSFCCQTGSERPCALTGQERCACNTLTRTTIFSQLQEARTQPRWSGAQTRDSTATWGGRLQRTRRRCCDGASHSTRRRYFRLSDAKPVYPSRLISLQFCMQAPLKS